MIGADGLYRRLLDAHGAPRWWSDDPFTVMLQAVLVQRSTWRTVETTCAAFPGRLTAEAAARLKVLALRQAFYGLKIKGNYLRKILIINCPDSPQRALNTARYLSIIFYVYLSENRLRSTSQFVDLQFAHYKQCCHLSRFGLHI